MVRAVTQEEAVRRIREMLGDKYDLSKVEYVDSKTRITLRCPVHGDFSKPPAMLWSGRGCEPCRHDANVVPIEIWLERFRSVHGDRYDYSLITDLRHPKIAVIICPDHGEFRKPPHEHWQRSAGCPTCSKAILTPQSNRYSRDEWIARFKSVFGDKYDYSKFEPMGARGNATFICPDHGEFQQKQDVHALGRLGCEGCKKQRAIDNFLKDALALFGDRFDYSKFEYLNAKTKSVIICPDHGEFMQAPDKHLQSKFPCPECNLRAKRGTPSTSNSDSSSYPIAYSRSPRKQTGAKRISKEDYLRRLLPSLPDQYTVDMSKYVGLTEGMITLTCPTHGNSTYGPQNLLVTKHKCKSCALEAVAKGKTKGYNDFISDATTVHNGKYTYPDCTNYVNRKSVVTIICSEHGPFKKKAQKHLTGQGCLQCGMADLRKSGRLTGGYSMALFDADDELSNKPGTIYYVKVGSVYKIGITALDVRRRLSAIKSVSKRDVQLIKSHSCTLRDAYVLEQSILKTYEEFRTVRRWSTEVFTGDVLSGIDIANVPLVPREEMDDWGYSLPVDQDGE